MQDPVVSALIAAFLVAAVLFVLTIAIRVKSLEEMSLKELEEEVHSLKARIRELKSIPGYSETVLADFESRLNEASGRLFVERVLARPERPPPTPEEQKQIDALQEMEIRAFALGQTPEEYSRTWVKDLGLRKTAYLRLGMPEAEAAERAFLEAGTDAPFPEEKGN
jgi:hypothetical protein